MAAPMKMLKNIRFCGKTLSRCCYSNNRLPSLFLNHIHTSAWRCSTEDAPLKNDSHNGDFFGIDGHCQQEKTDKQRVLSTVGSSEHGSASENTLSTNTDKISRRQNKTRKHSFHRGLKGSQIHSASNEGYDDRFGLSDKTNRGINSRKASSLQDKLHVEDDFIDEQYFKYNRNSPESRLGVQEGSLDNNMRGNQNNRRRFSGEELDTDNLIDDQYFIYENEQGGEVNRKSLSNGSKSKSAYDIDNMEFIDDQYFGASSDHGETFEDPINSSGKQPLVNKQGEPIGSTKRNTSKPKETSNTSESAYDIAMKIRQEVKMEKLKNSSVDDSGEMFSGPVDSKGFRILKYQVQDIMNTPSGMVVDLLKKTILYNKGDIVAIDKPYGLPSHGGPGVHMSVGQLLPALAERLDPTGQLSSLHLINRLDKETTGVMLLAKTAQMAHILKGYFIRREVTKKYWVITKGVPRPVEGIVKIPISESDMGKGIHRMTLRPEYHKEFEKVMKKRSLDGALEAVTKYKVLQEHGSAALVECQPITGVKHQIRVHFGFGLNTPILGDHKYSHFSKLAPQRLHSDMLVNLGIRQSKARHVPMHLHAKSLVIPEFENGRNLIISAKLPQHFLINMRRLKLNKSS